MGKRLFLFLSAIALLSSCAGGENSSISDEGSSFEVETFVYDYVALPEMEGEITYSFEGDYVDIDEENNTVCGTLGNTETTLTMSNGSLTYKVNVKVGNREYASNHASAEQNEGWFNEVSVDPISGLSDDFASGIDVSSCYYLYQNGQHFYNEEGIEESLFSILANHDVNWVRFRLWHDPYNYNFLDSDGNPTPYGGGLCDFTAIKWMSEQAKKFGLKIYLDFHYSDFWADPSKQVIPKAWSSFTTVSQFENAIYDYTYETLTSLKEADALPDMVSIGNENINGILMQKPGTDRNGYTYNADADYATNRTSLSSSLAGKIGTSNFYKYLSAGCKATRAVDPNIKIMIHMAKGLSATSTIEGIYNGLDNNGVDYDVIGLSGYSYWHFSKMSVLKNAMDYLSAAFPDKEIALAETAYGYTYESDSNCGHIYTSSSSGSAYPVSGYETSIQGQASIIRDTMAQVASIPNGLGVFYWEGAWTATAKCGWSDATSKVSWANQGLFSFNGKALGSLSLYKQIRAN